VSGFQIKFKKNRCSFGFVFFLRLVINEKIICYCLCIRYSFIEYLNFKATPRNFSSAVALQVRSGIVLIRTTETQPDLAIFQSVDILDKGAQSVGISAFHHATT